MKLGLGAVGPIVWIVGILLILAASANWSQEITNSAKGLSSLPQNAIDVLNAASLIFVIGVVVTSLGVHVFAKKYASSKALTGSFLGGIGGVMALLGIMSIAGLFLIGVFFIMLGLSFRELREKVNTGFLWALCVITGAFFISFLGLFFAYFAAIPTLVLLSKTLSE